MSYVHNNFIFDMFLRYLITRYTNITLFMHLFGGKGSLVGTATRYAWTILASDPGGGEILRTRPDRTWGQPSLLSNGQRVSFPEDKAAGVWR
jgi:hypothetical protein